MKRRTLLSALGAIPFIGGVVKAAENHIVTAADRGNMSLGEMKAAMDVPAKVEDVGEPLFDIHQWNGSACPNFHEKVRFARLGEKSYMGIEVGQFGSKMAIAVLLTESSGHLFAHFKVFCDIESPAMAHPILGRALKYECELFAGEREFNGTYITNGWNGYVDETPAQIIVNDVHSSDACFLFDKWSLHSINDIIQRGVRYPIAVQINANTMDPAIRDIRDRLQRRWFSHNGNAVIGDLVRHAGCYQTSKGMLFFNKHPKMKGVGVSAVTALIMANAARLADKESA